MATRTLKAWNGEDLSPEYDLTDFAIWERCEFGTRAWQGESTSTSIQIRDEQSQTSHQQNLPAGLTAYEYQARNVFELALGTDVLWRGRLANQSYIRGMQKAGRAREGSIYLEDINIELRWKVVHGWVRPAETDVERMLALAAAYLNGSPSVTTIVNTDGVVAGNTTALPAKTYNQTDVLSIMQEIALAAGKKFFLRPRASTSDSHFAELFYDLTDAVIDTCPFTITDHPDDVEANPTTHFAPIWDVGAAGELTAQETLSGVWLFYGVENYVHIADSSVSDITGWAEQIIYDDSVTTEAEANAKAQAIIDYRRSSERTVNCSIGPLTDAQIVQIKAGQRITIRAMAVPWADDLDYAADIGQLAISTDVQGRWWAHLQLDRPMRLGAYGSGSPIGPKPPTAPTEGGTVRLYPSIQQAGNSANVEANAAPNLDDTDADAAWDVSTDAEYYYMFDTPNASTSDASADWTAVNAAEQDDMVAGFVHILDGDLLEIIQNGGTVRGQFRTNSRSGIGVDESSQVNTAEWCIRVYRSGSGFVQTLEPVSDATNGTIFLAQSTPSNSVWTATFSGYASAAEGDFVVVDMGGHHSAPTSGATGFGIFWNDTASSDLPEDEVETANLRAWIEFRGTGTAGDTTSPTVNPGDETTGDDLDTYSPIDHTHAHGLLADDGIHMHDADQIDGLPEASAMSIQEEDGTPADTFDTLKVPNGALTDNGDGSASLALALPSHVHNAGEEGAAIDGAAVHRTGGSQQDIPTDTHTALEWEVEDFDTGDYWDAANPSRITITNAGWYEFQAQWRLSGEASYNTSPGAFFNGRFRINGLTEADYLFGDDWHRTLEALSLGGVNAHGFRYLEAGDYVEAITYQHTGETLKVPQNSIGDEHGWSFLFVRRVRDGGGATADDLVSLGVVGPILIADDHSTPLVFADLLQTEEGDDLLYADIGD